MYCIETSHLTHRFSNGEIAIRDLNLSVPEGSIFGFLGKNGAGKTTTLRLLLGLLKRQGGSIRIFNQNLQDHRLAILKKVGSLIESPSFYAHLTARENLKILQKIHQCPIGRINEVLEIVGLTNTGTKKISQFSLGMKQRLSIGMALLHQPKLLILDEPTNGLDPNGILEIRQLLQYINAEYKTTILISSHLLSEIEKLVDHLAIINRGTLLFQGTYSSLKLKQLETSTLAFETSNPAKAQEIIASHTHQATLCKQVVTMPAIDQKSIALIARQLVAADIELYQIQTQQLDLESIFMNLLKNDNL